jgi:hypothetical protein
VSGGAAHGCSPTPAMSPRQPPLTANPVACWIGHCSSYAPCHFASLCVGWVGGWSRSVGRVYCRLPSLFRFEAVYASLPSGDPALHLHSNMVVRLVSVGANGHVLTLGDASDPFHNPQSRTQVGWVDTVCDTLPASYRED